MAHDQPPLMCMCLVCSSAGVLLSPGVGRMHHTYMRKKVRVVTCEVASTALYFKITQNVSELGVNCGNFIKWNFFPTV